MEKIWSGFEMTGAFQLGGGDTFLLSLPLEYDFDLALDGDVLRMASICRTIRHNNAPKMKWKLFTPTTQLPELCPGTNFLIF